MPRRDLSPAMLGLAGAVVGGLLAYCGAVSATETDLKHRRLSAAYAGYASSLARNVSGAGLTSSIEARAGVALYGQGSVLTELAEGRAPCDGDWFVKALNSIRSQMGESKIDTKIARNVLCGPEELASRLACKRNESDTTITCHLYFSEPLRLSYLTLLDEETFKVSNGKVTGAKRLEPPSNQDWEITVTSGNGSETTISLPADRKCTEKGAICTSLGKQLSQSVPATVTAPSN